MFITLHRLDIITGQHTQMIDITPRIEELLAKSEINEGSLLVYCPHTTAGLTINENADPAVAHDVLARLEKLVPWQHPDDRHAEGNSAAHLKASLMGFSQQIPIVNGRLLLGTWQGVYLCEFDGPRKRHCFILMQVAA